MRLCNHSNRIQNVLQHPSEDYRIHFSCCKGHVMPVTNDVHTGAVVDIETDDSGINNTCTRPDVDNTSQIPLRRQKRAYTSCAPWVKTSASRCQTLYGPNPGRRANAFSGRLAHDLASDD